jgi:hypothetical protein
MLGLRLTSKLQHPRSIGLDVAIYTISALKLEAVGWIPSIFLDNNHRDILKNLRQYEFPSAPMRNNALPTIVLVSIRKPREPGSVRG